LFKVKVHLHSYKWDHSLCVAKGFSDVVGRLKTLYVTIPVVSLFFMYFYLYLSVSKSLCVVRVHLWIRTIEGEREFVGNREIYIYASIYWRVGLNYFETSHRKCRHGKWVVWKAQETLSATQRHIEWHIKRPRISCITQTTFIYMKPIYFYIFVGLYICVYVFAKSSINFYAVPSKTEQPI